MITKQNRSVKKKGFAYCIPMILILLVIDIMPYQLKEKIQTQREYNYTLNK